MNDTFNDGIDIHRTTWDERYAREVEKPSYQELETQLAAANTELVQLRGDLKEARQWLTDEQKNALRAEDEEDAVRKQLATANAQNAVLVSTLKEARQSLVFHIATLNLNGMTADEFSKFLEKHPNSRPRIIEQMDNVISQTPDAVRDEAMKRAAVIQAAIDVLANAPRLHGIQAKIRRDNCRDAVDDADWLWEYMKKLNDTHDALKAVTP